MDTIFCCIIPTRILDFPNNIFNWFFFLLTNVKLPVAHQEKRVCWIFKKTLVYRAHGRAIRTLVIASAERFKSLFIHAKLPRTRFARTIRVPNKFNNAFFIPKLRVEIATQRIFSQLLHACVQRIIGFCGSVEGLMLTISVKMNWLPCSSNVSFQKIQTLS